MSREALHGKFLRSRADQLADYLRGCVARGELVEPLPSVRDWSSQLGVGRGSLEGALKILAREGVMRVLPRQGIRLISVSKNVTGTAQSRLVRWLYYGRDFPDLSSVMEILAPISERLRWHDIRFSIERCDTARLRAIHSKGENQSEMFVLTSLPQNFQRMFADFQTSAMILGLPFPGVSLPFISIDVMPAIRHATHRLARRGFRKVNLIVKEGSRQPMEEDFRRYCVEATPTVEGHVLRMPMEYYAQAAAVERWAGRITGRVGVIAVYPIPTSNLMTALMKRGISVPDEVEVVALNTSQHYVRVVPVPALYLYPAEALAKAVCRAALHYFEHGRLPVLRKMIPLELGDIRRNAGAGWP